MRVAFSCLIAGLSISQHVCANYKKWRSSDLQHWMQGKFEGKLDFSHVEYEIRWANNCIVRRVDCDHRHHWQCQINQFQTCYACHQTPACFYIPGHITRLPDMILHSCQCIDYVCAGSRWRGGVVGTYYNDRKTRIWIKCLAFYYADLQPM